jgi:hypothetical protein
MNTQEHPLPTVPPIDYKAIRKALKAYGITLKELSCAVECRCDVCGAQ